MIDVSYISINLINQIINKHKTLNKYIKDDNIDLITHYEGCYNKLLNKMNIYYKKLSIDIINLIKILAKNNVFMKNKIQLKFNNIITLYKIKIYFNENNYNNKLSLVKKYYINFCKVLLYKNNINSLLLFFVKKNCANINKFSDISMKIFSIVLKQKLKESNIIYYNYINDKELILTYYNLFKENNNEIKIIDINKKFINLNNLICCFKNILFLFKKIDNKQLIIINLNNLYKYCNYFIDKKNLHNMISKSSNIDSFLLNLEKIIQFIYNKNIESFKKNKKMYFFLNKLIYT